MGDREAQRVGEARHGLPPRAHSRPDRHDAEVDQGGAAAAQLDGCDRVEFEHGRDHLTRGAADAPDRHRAVQERPDLDRGSRGRDARLGEADAGEQRPALARADHQPADRGARPRRTSLFERVLVGVAVSTVAPAASNAVTVGAAPVWASVTSTLVAARGSCTSVDVPTSQPT